MQLDVELRNTADAPQSLAYRLDGPTGMPVEGWWFRPQDQPRRGLAAAGLRDVVVRFDGNPVMQIDCPQIAEGDVEPMEQGRRSRMRALMASIFRAVMIPVRKSLDEVVVRYDSRRSSSVRNPNRGRPATSRMSLAA